MTASTMYTLIGADGRSYRSATKGSWGGHHRSKIYGRLDCVAAQRAIARGGYIKQRVFFADEATAVAAGYRPCAVCCKDRYEAGRTPQRSPTVNTAKRGRPVPSPPKRAISS